MKLNQVIAIEKGTKGRALQELTDAHQMLQKPAFRNEPLTRNVLVCANGRQIETRGRLRPESLPN